MRQILRSIRSNSYLQLLIAIMMVGAALRFYGIPNAENTDEYNEVMEALRMASGKLNYERWWKKGYQNILAVEYGIYFLIGYLFQMFSSPWDFAAKIVRDMEPLFLIGRYTTATLGTLSIAIVYVIGRRLFNDRVGLIAACLFAVESINVWTSHLVNTDVPLTFFFLLSFYFAAKLYQTGDRWAYAGAAFFGAIAINIKIIGVGAGVMFALWHVMRCMDHEDKKWRWFFSREILLSVIAFLAGIIVTNPTLVFGVHKFIAFHYNVYSNVYDEVPYASEGNGYYTYMMILYRNFGLPFFLVSIAGLLYSLFKRTRIDVILLCYLVVMFLILGGTTFLVQNRYLMILFPVMFIVVGRFLDSSVDRFTTPGSWRNILAVLATCLLLIFPLSKSIAYVRTLSEENTSVASKKWIEENIPAGSKVLMDAGRSIITFGPRLNQSRARLEEQMEIIKGLKQGETYDSPLVRIVDSYAAIYFELLLKNVPEITYDITTTELGRNVEAPEYYKQHGYEYYVHNTSLRYRTDDPLWRNKYPKSALFYDTFDKQYELLKELGPTATRSGAQILIYKVR